MFLNATANLIQHQFLIGQCLCHDDGGTQGGDGSRGGPINALDQFQIVLADQIHRQIALDGHGKLDHQILHLLTQVKQHFLANDAHLLRIDRLDFGQLTLQSRVDVAADWMYCSSFSMVRQALTFSSSMAALPLRSSSWPP